MFLVGLMIQNSIFKIYSFILIFWFCVFGSWIKIHSPSQQVDLRANHERLGWSETMV